MLRDLMDNISLIFLKQNINEKGGKSRKKKSNNLKNCESQL